MIMGAAVPQRLAPCKPWHTASAGYMPPRAQYAYSVSSRPVSGQTVGGENRELSFK